MLSVLGTISHLVWYKKHSASKCCFVEGGKKCIMRKKETSSYCKKHDKIMKDDLREGNLCSFVLLKKKRRCRMQAQSGQVFCAEHMVHSENNEKRIPCPLDGKHSVEVSLLDDHLTKCNSRLPDDPWISYNINAVGNNNVGDSEGPSKEDINFVSSRLPEIHALLQHKIYRSVLQATIVDAEILKANSDHAKKHLVQISSVIGHLQMQPLIHKEDEIIVDLGGGKGELTYYMAKCFPKSKFVIIDRSGMRNKFDARIRKESPNTSLDRLRCSIEHLDLAVYPPIKESSSVSFVCKHFCGSAYDMGLRCIDKARKRGVAVDSFVLAPCCMHKSNFDEYCGTRFLEECEIGSKKHYIALRHIASWANCGFPHGNSEIIEENESPDALKKEFGRIAKLVLHWGRAEFLRNLGYKVDVIEYCDYSVTPENLALVGYFPG